MPLNPLVWASDGKKFLSEVQVEFKKITWPAQKEAIGGTIGVVVIVVVVTTALSLVDIVLGQLVQLIFS